MIPFMHVISSKSKQSEIESSQNSSENNNDYSKCKCYFDQSKLSLNALHTEASIPSQKKDRQKGISFERVIEQHIISH